jgi:hypothetical protein
MARLPVTTVTNVNFGPLIAYLIPGATALYGVGAFAPAVRSLFALPPADAPTIGGFLYLTLASLTAGMVVTAVRWAVVDRLHHVTGLRPGEWDFSKFVDGRVEAYNVLNEIHYRHYQFYANMFVAVAFAFACLWQAGEVKSWRPVAAFVVLELVFVVTSRDTLRKYYTRVGQVLARPS